MIDASVLAPAFDSDGMRHARRAVRAVVGAKLIYNVTEGIVAIAAGAAAASSALIGFGLDSAVEVASALAIAWQFAGGRPHAEREHVALRLVAGSFFALGVFVAYQATRSLAGGAEPEHSTVGIVLAAVSLAVMPGLALAQGRLGRRLGSTAVVADSRQTMICAGLSAVLLFGLVANSVAGWSWADPVAALVIAAVAVREGVAALHGETCCASPAMLVLGPDRDDTCCDDDLGPGL